VTRAHVMDKGDDAKAVMSKGRSSCMVQQGCNARVMHDRRGDDILPCE
jgi:hypothetical protein